MERGASNEPLTETTQYKEGAAKMEARAKAIRAKHAKENP